MGQKIKSIICAILCGLVVILFTVMSGVICTITGIVENTLMTWVVQGIFCLLSLIPAIFLMKRFGELQILDIKQVNTHGVRRCFYLIPCFIILAPMIMYGFADEKPAYFLIAFTFCLAIGISEEIYFRGIVTGILKKQFDTSKVILISTGIFGLGHAAAAFSGMSGLLVVLTIINALIFGWLAAEILYAINCLYPLMLFHCLFIFLSKAAPLSSELEMKVDIIRGTLMFLFALWLLIARRCKIENIR